MRLRLPIPVSLVLLTALALPACREEPRPSGPDAGDPAGDTTAAARAPGVPSAGAPDTGAPPPTPAYWAFTCPDGLRFRVRYQDNQAVVTLSDGEVELPHVPAASGSRYQSGDTLFWDRGGAALLEVGPQRHEACEGRGATSSEDAARLLGFDFRAVGEEPGWMVDVDADGQVRWVGQYGTVRFATPAPERVETGEGAWEWRAGTGDRRLTVAVREERCLDGMSGEAFTHAVGVTVGGETLQGCGSFLTPPSAGAPATPSPGRSPGG